MRRGNYIILVALFVAPFFSFAQGNTVRCSSDGYTVVTINGIFNDENGAQNNLLALLQISPQFYRGQKINYQYLLNPSHLAGLGDLATAAYQKYFEDETVSDYDLVEMLRSASDKVNTRKLLLVAHSQGNFYANSFYDTVVGKTGGVPAESIGIYAVATPASRVAGDGKWITSDTDKVIAGLVAKTPGRNIMRPNTSIKLASGDDPLGHSFSDVYLKYRGAEIVSGIEASLDKLKVDPLADQSLPCIDPPKLTLVHKIEGLTLAAADPVANLGADMITSTAYAGYKTASAVASAVNTLANQAASGLASAVSSFNTAAASLPKASQIAAATPSLAAKVADSDPQINIFSSKLTPVSSSASVATSETSVSLAIAPTTSVPILAAVVINNSATTTSSLIFSQDIASSSSPVADLETSADSIAGDSVGISHVYIAVPLVYEATPIPESHEIPSVIGGGDPTRSAVADIANDNSPTASDDSSASTTYNDLTQIVEISTTTATSTNSSGGSAATSSLPVPAPLEPSVLVASRPVVINEVAWGGTVAHAEDEWIELYNRSSASIDLSGFTLYSKTDNSPYINLSGTIPAYDYFLIEAKNPGETDELSQSPVKNIPADLWTDFGAGLSDRGEDLILSYASTTIDELPLCNNWCGAIQRTTERYDPDLPGTSLSNWSYNNGIVYNGLDTNGNTIYGTPRARNGLNYLINRGATISSDLTLKKSTSPYVVYGQQHVSQGATLTFEPGVVTKFLNRSSLVADGNVVANGTLDDPIIFTALNDDTYGGNLDGKSLTPVKGDWFGVELYAKSASSSFDHTIFRYGGDYGPDASYKKAMLYVGQNNTPVTNSKFEFSKAYGLSLDHASSTVSGNSFVSNSGNAYSTGINIFQGSPLVSNNTFVLNDTGVGVSAASSTVTNNIFSSTTYSAVYVSGPAGVVSGNSASDSEFIYLYGSVSSAGGTTTLYSNPIPYYLYGNVTVPPGSGLDIKEGTTIKGSFGPAASFLSVYGNLNIDTSTSTGVVFTSTYTPLRSGDWMGIVFGTGASSHITGATIAGARTGASYGSTPIYLDNVVFSNNNLGVSASSPSQVVKASNVNFFGNTNNKSPANLW